MNGIFTETHQIQLGSDLVADTTAETLSSIEDMEGYDEITFLVKLGDVDAAAVLTLAVKENTASSSSSPTPTAISLASANVSGAVTAVVTTGAAVLTESSGNLDDKIIAITVSKSQISKRYVFLSVTVATESYEIDAIITIKSKPRTVPVTQPTDVVSCVEAFK